MERILADCLDQVPEDLPTAVRERYQLAQAGWAMRTIHFPASWEELEVARRRLVFEELFYFSAGLELMRKRRSRGTGVVCRSGDLTAFYATLPFQLTGAQRRAAQEAAPGSDRRRSYEPTAPGGCGQRKNRGGSGLRLADGPERVPVRHDGALPKFWPGST